MSTYNAIDLDEHYCRQHDLFNCWFCGDNSWASALDELEPGMIIGLDGQHFVVIQVDRTPENPQQPVLTLQAQGQFILPDNRGRETIVPDEYRDVAAGFADVSESLAPWLTALYGSEPNRPTVEVTTTPRLRHVDDWLEEADELLTVADEMRCQPGMEFDSLGLLKEE